MGEVSETKFTSGPWKVEDGTGYHRGNLVITANHAGMQSDTPLARLGAFDEVSKYDANLIAAAPELYEALEQTTTMLEALAMQLTSWGKIPVINNEYRAEENRTILAKARSESDAQS